MTETIWVVAFRDRQTHQVIGPVWFHEQEAEPVKWAQRACYGNCEYAIMNGQGYSEDRGVPDRILQRQKWHPKPLVIYCEEIVCEHISANTCRWCGAAICPEHSRLTISDKGRDVFACPECADTGDLLDL